MMRFWVLLASLAVAARSQGGDGVVAYWNADRPCPAWRDNAWQKGGTGRVHFDPAEKRHGIASVRIEGIPDEETSISSVCAHISVREEGRYVLRFWSRRTGKAGTAICQSLAHRMVDERRSKPIGWLRLDGKDPLPIALGSDWRLHEIPLETLTGGTARLYFYFRVKGETTLWVDEFSLAKEGVEVELGGEQALSDADYAGTRFDDDALPSNLLRNGGFEDGLAHWQLMTPKITCAVDDSQAAAGTCSLRVHGLEFAAGGVFQRVRIDPRRRYRLSMRANGKAFTGYVFTKVLGFDRENHPRGWLGGEALYSAQNAPWTEKSVEFTPRPSTDNVVVYVRVEDTIGDVWVDDVRLRPLPQNGFNDQ